MGMSGLLRQFSLRNPSVCTAPLLISVGLFIFYVLIALNTPEGVVYSVDEGGKVIYIQNVLNTGHPETDIRYLAHQIDSGLNFVPLTYWIERSGKLYTWWPVGFPLISSFFYWLLGWVGFYILPALGGASTAFISARIFQEIRPLKSSMAWIVSLVVGLATPIWFYSTRIWEHTLNTACLLLAFWLILKSIRSRSMKWMVYAGASASLACFLRIETAGYLLGIGLVLLRLNWRKAIPFGMGFLGATIPWSVINYFIVGNPFSQQVSSFAQQGFFEGLAQQGVKFFAYLLFNSPSSITYSLPRMWLIIACLLVIGTIIFQLIPPLRKLSLYAAGALFIICSFGLFTTQGYFNMSGFLLISPFLVLGGWYFTSLDYWKKEPFLWLLGGSIFSFLLIFLLRAWAQAGGTQWGMRYLLALYPLLTIVVVVVLVDAAQKISARFFYVAYSIVLLIGVLVGFGYQVRGTVTTHQMLKWAQESNRAVMSLNLPILATDCRYIAQLAPDLFQKEKIVYVPGENKLAWEENAKKNGISSYDLVQFDLCRFLPLDQVALLRKDDPDGIITVNIIIPH